MCLRLIYRERVGITPSIMYPLFEETFNSILLPYEWYSINIRHNLKFVIKGKKC